MLGRAVRESQHQEIALSGPRGRRLDDAPGAQGQAGRTGRNRSLGRGRDREAKTSREEHQGDGEELLERYAKLVPEQLEDLLPAERRHTHQMLQVGVSLPKQGGIDIRLPFLTAGCSEVGSIHYEQLTLRQVLKLRGPYGAEDRGRPISLQPAILMKERLVVRKPQVITVYNTRRKGLLPPTRFGSDKHYYTTARGSFPLW